MGKSASTGTRRRGADLENAILDATWAELVEQGYARLTMEDVASRAGTSRTVLARRWDGKLSLAIAAIRQQMAKHPLEVEECGDLRAELMEFVNRASSRAIVIPVVFSLLSSEYFQDTSSPPQRLREALTEGESGVFAAILQRAVERGEIDPEKLNPAIESLLGDLLRHHALMTLSAPPLNLRKAWVDTVFIPLVKKD